MTNVDDDDEIRCRDIHCNGQPQSLYIQCYAMVKDALGQDLFGQFTSIKLLKNKFMRSCR